MKIIFLDIDGVLNSKKHKVSASDKFEDNYIDLSRVKHIADIVNATDAKIVLISSLRIDWNKSSELCGDDGNYINRCFAEYGLSIMDKTPYISFFTARRKEIITWLSANKSEVESFVIIDDMKKGWEDLGNRVVNTNPDGYGIEEEHVKKAIKLLQERVVF